jgi:ribosomal protein S27AE
VLLKVDGPWELQALAEALQDQGISSQIDTHPLGASISEGRAAVRGQNAQLGIYVGRADLAAARAFATELAAQTLADTDTTAVVHDPHACPACGEPTADDAAACGACGLEFPEMGAEDA